MDKETTTTTPRPRLRVLVIEDDGDTREALTETVEQAGYEVATAREGREGLDQMRAFHPDVVLLDLMMPGLDGWQFRVEQRRDPVLAFTPVVAMSASRSPTAAAVDADLYLQKPIDGDALLSALDSAARTHEQRRERAARQQQERLAALGTLAAGLAHEINNPLTYVLLHLTRIERLLAKAPGGPSPWLNMLESSLRSISEGCGRVRDIVASVRTFSRVDSIGQFPIDLVPVVETAVRLTAHELRQRAQLVLDLGDTPSVIANEGRLGQVMVNLLTNAAQAIAEGAPESNSIRVATWTDAEGRAVLEVTDTGHGIPERIQNRIFDPFFSTRPVGQGQGLGLSICQGIVTSLGGEITVKSRPGWGSRFRVVLPPAGEAALHPPGSAVAQGSGVRNLAPRRLRVLVIDDDPAVLGALDVTLEHEHDIVTCDSGRHALARLREDDAFDAILCDLDMAPVSGIDVHHELERLQPDLAERMIFTSGGAFTPAARAFLDDLGERVLEKPLDLGELRRRLAELAR